MIINTGMRTDIPAFYSDWFVNRLKAGFVLVRNPYNPRSVTRYRLSPDVVDLIGHLLPEDQVREARQESWIDPQTVMDLSPDDGIPATVPGTKLLQEPEQ